MQNRKSSESNACHKCGEKKQVLNPIEPKYVPVNLYHQCGAQFLVRIVSLKVFNLNCQTSVLKFLKRLLFYRSDSEKAKCDAHDARLTEDEFLA